MSSLKSLGLLSNYTCTSDKWPLSRGFAESIHLVSKGNLLHIKDCFLRFT